jgi:hypothetical protein
VAWFYAALLAGFCSAVDKEGLVFLRHAASYCGYQLLTASQQIIQRYGLCGHAVEAPHKLVRKVLRARHEHFRDRPVMTNQIDDEGAAQIVADPFVRQEIADIKEVTRMLPIQGYMAFDGMLFEVKLLVHMNGHVDMIDDKQLGCIVRLQ